ncbi:MAG: hypothetical protein ABEK42_08370, partial [Thiohalorhabdaceae bacterium]
GTLYLVWRREVITDDRKGLGAGYEKAFMDLLMSCSTDGGSSWSDPVRVNDTRLTYRNPMARVGQTDPLERDRKRAVKEPRLLDVAATGPGNLAVLWKDWRQGHAALFLAYTTDGGRTWSRNRPIREPALEDTHRGALAFTGADRLVALLPGVAGGSEPRLRESLQVREWQIGE